MFTINEQKTNPSNAKIAIVVSRFNEEVTSKLLEGAIERLKERDQQSSNSLVVWVPGAVEIPITAQKLAKSKQFDAVITLGAVIRGETTHYDYVCDIVSRGCEKIALETQIPVIFGVLTTENEEQAFDRLGGKHGHKGKDAVDTALEMISVIRKLP